MRQEMIALDLAQLENQDIFELLQQKKNIEMMKKKKNKIHSLYNQRNKE